MLEQRLETINVLAKKQQAGFVYSFRIFQQTDLRKKNANMKSRFYFSSKGVWRSLTSFLCVTAWV